MANGFRNDGQFFLRIRVSFPEESRTNQIGGQALALRLGDSVESAVAPDRVSGREYKGLIPPAAPAVGPRPTPSGGAIRVSASPGCHVGFSGAEVLSVSGSFADG